MKVELVNEEEFKKELEEEINKLSNEKVMEALAVEVIKGIRERTEQGLDSTSKDFVDYSTKPMYMGLAAKYNANRTKPVGGRETKSGKSMHFPGGYKEYRNNLGVSKPNLENKGTLLQAMQYAFEGLKRIVITIAPIANRQVIGAAINNGEGTQPKREWFDYGQTDAEDRILQEYWEKLVKDNSQEIKE